MVYKGTYTDGKVNMHLPEDIDGDLDISHLQLPGTYYIEGKKITGEVRLYDAKLYKLHIIDSVINTINCDDGADVEYLKIQDSKIKLISGSSYCSDVVGINGSSIENIKAEFGSGVYLDIDASHINYLSIFLPLNSIKITNGTVIDFVDINEKDLEVGEYTIDNSAKVPQNLIEGLKNSERVYQKYIQRDYD